MQKYRILIVDDSIEWLKSHLNMIRTLFPEEMFEINTASNARKGIETVLLSRENPYDIVITDLEMEKIFDEAYAGSWLVKNLINRDECKNTKFLIISGAYNLLDIAMGLKVEHIAKSNLLGNPIKLKYKLMELLGIEEV